MSVTIDLSSTLIQNPQNHDRKMNFLSTVGQITSFIVPLSLYSVLSFTRYDEFNGTLALAITNAILNGFLYKNNIVEEAEKLIHFFKNVSRENIQALSFLKFVFYTAKFYVILNLTAVASLLLTGDVLANKKDFSMPVVWIFSFLGCFLEGVLAITPNRCIVDQGVKLLTCDFGLDSLPALKMDRSLIFKGAVGFFVAFLSLFFTLATVGSVQRASEWEGLSWMKYPFPLLFLIKNETVAPLSTVGIFFLFTYYVTKSFINIFSEIFSPEKFHFGNWLLRIALWAISIATTQASSAIQIEGQRRVLAWNNAWSDLIIFINKIHITPDVIAGIIGGALNVSGIHNSFTTIQKEYQERHKNNGSKKWSDCLLKWVTPLEARDENTLQREPIIGYGASLQ